MPWQEFKDVDDVIHDWLKSQYTPYRNALPDPTVIPEEAKIQWDSEWAGIRDTSFAVVEDITNHANLGLGVKTIEFEGVHIVRITYRYVESTGKPPVLKKLREFVTKTLHANIVPLPSALTTEGIRFMLPLNSRIFTRFATAQGDFWIMEIRVVTKVLNDIV